MEVRFGPFRFHIGSGELFRNEFPVRFQEQPAKLLAALIEANGEIVSREELRKRIWPQDTFVDFDGSLNTAVRKVRHALRDDADQPLYVETVPKQGYRFIAPIERLEVVPEAPVKTPDLLVGPPPKPRLMIHWSWVGLLLVALAVGIWLYIKQLTPVTPLQLSIPLPDNTELHNGFGPTVTISDDGQVIGFIARQGEEASRLWLRRLSEPNAQAVYGTEEIQYAQLLPDGSQFLGVKGNQLGVYQPGRGEIRRLANLGPGVPLAALWGKDGYVYFTAPKQPGDADQPGCLWRVLLREGAPELIQCGQDPKPLPEFILPVMVVDRNRLLISTFRYTRRNVELFDLQKRKRQALLGPGNGGLWLPDGWLVYHQDFQLRGVKAKLDPPGASGTPLVLIRNVQRAGWSGGNIAYARNGTLLFEPVPRVVGDRNLVWVDLEGRESPAGVAPGPIELADLSPNGKQLLLRRYDAESSRWSLWATDFQAGQWTEIARDAAFPPSGLWNEDATKVFYSEGETRLAAKDITTQNPPLFPGPSSEYRQAPASRGPGGTVLFAQGYMPGLGHQIFRWLPGHNYEIVIYGEHLPAFSPDGRWLLTRTLKGSIHLRPYPQLGEPILVAPSGQAPLWSPDGRFIYYRTGEHMIGVDFTPGNPPQLAAPKRLFPDDYVPADQWNRQYAVHPDGKRFLLVKKDPSAGGSRSLNVILNWPAGFTK